MDNFVDVEPVTAENVDLKMGYAGDAMYTTIFTNFGSVEVDHTPSQVFKMLDVAKHHNTIAVFRRRIFKPNRSDADYRAIVMLDPANVQGYVPLDETWLMYS